MSAVHGGQVLLSGATCNLVRDHVGRLEPAAELRDLGEHRFRDLEFTEHVFQLVVPDLPKDFPELRTAGLVTPKDELIDLDRRFGGIRHIGGGGMGEVYLAHHEALDRDMALKVLNKQYVNDRQFDKRFKREAKSAASLSHPNIATVYDAGEGVFEGVKTPYIAMEYVPGGTLKEQILQQREPLPIATTTELTLQVARALEAVMDPRRGYRPLDGGIGKRRPRNATPPKWLTASRNPSPIAETVMPTRNRAPRPTSAAGAQSPASLLRA